ncbi:class I SAM-dependent methyltransferase [Candidatus Izemoplasma sp. B36]|uniref:class I SAM-dependent methyltransferase n=1 Tax=Candidatus Izemoplasma sp. B36 TaxID=3242468 RepID=UPI003557D0E7
MNHYYTNNSTLDSKEKDIYFKIKEKSFHFITDYGVFSRSGLDFGSRLLIESVLNIKANHVLDLGCGYGPIGIIYKYFNNEANVTMLDINNRAIELSIKNAKLNRQEVKVLNNNGFSDIDSTYNLIITNPPIRTGKKLIYHLFLESYNHLVTNGRLIFVINKKHGALSAIKYCEEIYNNVNIINKKSGFYVIECIK